MNSSIVVLGGTGFIGSALIRQLKESGFVNVSSIGLHNTSKIKGVKSYKVDILNKNKLERICKSYDVIVNCIGQVTSPINSCLKQNTIGIANIIEVAKKYNKKLVHLSSVNIYGTATKVDENSELNPETPYSMCKYFAEYLLLKELKKEQLLIFRLSNIYGIGSRGILGYLKRSFESDRKLVFNNNGNLLRYYLYIDDCAYNIVEFLKNSGKYGVYNLIGNEKYTVKQLISKFEKIVKIKFDVEYESKEPYENIKEISKDKISAIIQPKYEFTLEKYIKMNFAVK